MSYDRRSQSRRDLASALRAGASAVPCFRCVVGFDGFVDSVFRVVSRRLSPDEYVAFGSIPEFAERVAASAGKSSDTEIVLQEVRFGGNAPLMASSLSRLGLRTCCVGALGLPEVEAPFAAMDGRCARLSIGPAGRTYAFEFDDGKLMFGQVKEMGRIGWREILERAGHERLTSLLRESDLVGVVNWTYLFHMGAIVEGLRGVLSTMPEAVLARKRLFVDLADVSTRSPDDVLGMCRAMEAVGELLDTTLGLNEHEAEVLCECLGLTSSSAGVGDLARLIASKLKVHTVAVHGPREAAAARDGEVATVEGFHVAAPAVSTGGGDAFNAGFCLGVLLDSTLERAVAAGSAVSSRAVAAGRSPSLEELIAFLEGEDP
jgi:sugar/nucleoside kinase (ribokinase family)